MRTNLPKIKNLYILGAGASYGLSVRNAQFPQNDIAEVPLDKDFVAGLEIHHSDQFQEFAKQSLQGANERARINFARQPLEEAVLNRLDMYDFRATCNRQRIVKAGKAKRKLENPVYLHYLALLIAYRFSDCSLRHERVAGEFLDKIFPPTQDPKYYKNRIITFNYDTLLDDILLQSEKITPNKLYFDRIDENESLLRQQSTPRSKRFPDPLMLKLHGSINWRCGAQIYSRILEQNSKASELLEEIRNETQNLLTKIPTSDSKEMLEHLNQIRDSISKQNSDFSKSKDPEAPKFKGTPKKFLVSHELMKHEEINKEIQNLLEEAKKSERDESEEAQSPLIIPPMPAKPINSVSLLNFLWTRALEYVAAAEKIYIIGYSCPPSDKFAHALFREGFENKKNKTEVVLVNPDLEALSHYRKIIGKLDENISWICYPNIKSFLEKEMKIEVPRQRNSPRKIQTSRIRRPSPSQDEETLPSEPQNANQADESAPTFPAVESCPPSKGPKHIA